MSIIFHRNDVPDHLFSIPELNLEEDLLADPTGGEWFRLGAWPTHTPHVDGRGAEDVVSRQSMLLAPGEIAAILNSPEYLGNILSQFGKPQKFLRHEPDQKAKYVYAPFHRFEFGFPSVTSEPLVFVHFPTQDPDLLVNPDLWLFLRLEERVPARGIWWDQRRGVEVLRQRSVGNLKTVDIRVDYLQKYLKARQLSLVVAHFRYLSLSEPSPNDLQAFVTKDVAIGSAQQGAKAIIENWGPRDDIPGKRSLLQRRLHLWFEVKPQVIDIDNPGADEPPFDPYAFTLPTRAGPVAPARWRNLRQAQERTFDGVSCDFMDRVFFRQEVLTKYEGVSGFDVSDDGSVRCGYFWALNRSTSRIGNELLATAIGDFAEGVPFEEWPHWKQYAVEPPSLDAPPIPHNEVPIPDAVNSLVRALRTLNLDFDRFAASIGVAPTEPLWKGALDSLSGRQLKWIYPGNTHDDEFLKRATLTSTLVLDELNSPSLRNVLISFGKALHLNSESNGKPLGSRNLLQRIVLIASLLQNYQPALGKIPDLVMQAENKPRSSGADDLQEELSRTFQSVRDEFAPLAFLYDLRMHGGFAHAARRVAASKAATQLGLPKSNWHRADYLRLLSLVEGSITKVGGHLNLAARELESMRALDQDEPLHPAEHS